MVDPSFHFSFSTDLKIWHTAINPQGKMALELRNEETQEINFQVLDLNSGNASEKFHIDQTDWWSSLLSIHDDLILIEQYPDAQNPTNKNLLVYSIDQQSLLHIENDFQFNHLENHQICGHEPGSQQAEKRIAFNQIKAPFATDLISPVFYAPDSESNRMVYEFLDISDPKIGSEYFETGIWTIICYYERLEKKFDRFLHVLKEDDPFLKIKLDQNMDGFASGGFLIFNELLVFIENSQNIYGIALD